MVVILDCVSLLARGNFFSLAAIFLSDAMKSHRRERSEKGNLPEVKVRVHFIDRCAVFSKGYPTSLRFVGYDFPQNLMIVLLACGDQHIENVFPRRKWARKRF
jgi:hypothetical protein